MLQTPVKRTLTLTDLDAEAGFVLPPRETMLVTVVINNVLNGLTVDIDVRNVKLAVQVCAIVELLNAELFTVDTLDCDIQQ